MRGLVAADVDDMDCIEARTYLVDRRRGSLAAEVSAAVGAHLGAGLHWPAAGRRPIGAAQGTVGTSRGFHVAMWRQGDLGYALVSDVNEADLLALGAKIATHADE